MLQKDMDSEKNAVSMKNRTVKEGAQKAVERKEIQNAMEVLLEFYVLSAPLSIAVLQF